MRELTPSAERFRQALDQRAEQREWLREHMGRIAAEGSLRDYINATRAHAAPEELQTRAKRRR